MIATSKEHRALPGFVLLYAAMFGAYGVASPFLPAFLGSRGVSPEALGLVLAAATGVRLLSSPLAGRLADRLRNLRIVLACTTALAAAATLAYQPAYGVHAILVVALLQAAALAPMTVLADALALGQRFEYGWVRGTGSAAFIAGTLLSGQTVAAWGLEAIVWSQALLLAFAALAASRVPEIAHDEVRARRSGSMLLFRLPAFRTLVVAAALILGSHAMHDSFAVMRWSAAGIGPGAASLLWSEAVAAEVVVFFAAGPMLIARLTPAGAIALAAVAGIVRWAAMAQSTSIAVLALVQPLHGITFALLHLACMRLIARVVPQGLEGTAQAVYATLGVGAASALLTLASGTLYARAGAQAFWFMAALCALALPLAWRLRL